MESVQEESQQEVTQEDQPDKDQPKQQQKEQEQGQERDQEQEQEQKQEEPQQKPEEEQPAQSQSRPPEQHGIDASQVLELADSDNDGESKPLQGDQASQDKPDEPTYVAQPERISPAPSLLIITPHESAFAQMEAFLQVQLDKCIFYKKVFGEQSNTSLAAKFETFFTLTEKDIDMLRKAWNEGGRLPGFKFETIRVTCTPTNVDVKDKELHIVVKTSNLPVESSRMSYVVGEFEFPTNGKQSSLTESAEQWLKTIRIEPKKLFCCGVKSKRQLDMAKSVQAKPFYDPESTLTEYSKPLRFFIDKGRSRTLKRKFKPIKLTFYEKTSFVKFDKKLGSVIVKLDSINDDASITMRSTVMDGRKQTEAVADIRVRVREPLVDKALKTHEEKFLVLT